jgi:D-alanyl-D-alanine carboxypeptidase
MQHALNEAEQTNAGKAAACVECYVRSELFSGSVLVADSGQVLFRSAFGLANRELDIPNAHETKFRIGSITKQFTAAAILQLVERGKLKLDEPVSTYYPHAPAAWQGITIRHLLTHTSGIPSYTDPPDFAVRVSKLDLTPKEIIQLTQNEPLQFEPGTQFDYNNTGYVLLGHVIESVTGQSYSQYLQHNVFRPLTMHATGYDDSVTILSLRASGYRISGGHWENASYIAMSLPFASGSLYSTIDDLLLWDRALSGGKILSISSVQAMFADYGHGYGFGWFVGEGHGHRLQRHGGGINGFRSTIDRYPDDGLTIIVLSNLETAPVDKIARDLAALYLGVAEAIRETTVDPIVLDRYAGYYQLGPKFVLAVSRDGGRLLVQGTNRPKREMFPESDRMFFSKVTGTRIGFEIDSEGCATRLMLHQNGRDRAGVRIDRAEAKRIEELPPKIHEQATADPKLFGGYVGRYQLRPNFILTISREGNRLFCQATGQRKNEIFPEGDRDYFFKIVDAQITFETGDQGRAIRLILHQGGLDTPAERID